MLGTNTNVKQLLQIHDHILELDLRNNKIGYPGIKYLYHNGEKLKLQVLKLNGNKIGVEVYEIITIVFNVFFCNLKKIISTVTKAKCKIVFIECEKSSVNAVKEFIHHSPKRRRS